MSWTTLAPIAKTAGRPMVSAYLTVNKDGAAKISLNLSDSVFVEFGQPKKADVMAGEDEHFGKLRVEFKASGAFDIKAFAKGGARIWIPAPEGYPDKATLNTACKLAEREKSAIIVEVPVAAWLIEVASRSAPRSATPKTPSSAPPPPAQSSRTLDVVEYLGTRGVKIGRLANNRFSVDGDTLLLGQVLKLVNDKRMAADLEPLSLDRVH